MPTLMDVAKLAGVSHGTVSNVFIHPERVRPELREHVEAAARQIGFQGPDPKGRLLRDGKVNAIGVVPAGGFGVADTLSNPVFRQLLLGISEVCDDASASLVIIPDRKGNGGIRTALVDGFILSRVDQVHEIESARLRRLPFVVIDGDPGPDVNSVRADARGGAYQAARHLIDLGHRHFGIISFLRDFGPPILHMAGKRRDPTAAGMAIDQDKLIGFAEAFAEAGIDIDAVPMVQAHPWEDKAAGAMLDAAPQATAILSMSAMQAVSVSREAQRRGLSVPRDLSVVGYNDTPEAAAAGLTTVDGKGMEKGRAAARILFEGGAVRREFIETQLIIRASTASPLS
ncbi:MAG: LacI family DNA-binding transcriptional regulator [Devosia sp.]